MSRSVRLLSFLTCALFCAAIGAAQEKSVRPSINDAFRAPDVTEFLGRFDDESREVFTRRKENYFVVFTKPAAADTAAEQRPGRGRGMGRGPGPEMRADQKVFHFLLDHHAEIRRSVKRLDNGVETLTESDSPEVAAKIQEHVASMHQRIKEGRGLRFWDELFVAIFRKHASIKMTVENTKQGVKVQETSEDRVAVALIQAHADVVSLFVKHGFDEAHKYHPVPAAISDALNLD
jgi:hypothetical protein